MGLLQPRQHVAHDGARFVHRFRLLDLGAELFVDGLPIETAGVFFPVLVANRGPDFFEGGDVKLFLRGRELPIER